MTSLRAKLIHYFVLPLRGTKRRMLNAEKFARQRILNVPVAAKPPIQINREFNITKKNLHNLEYYTVGPLIVKSKGVILYLHGGAYVNELITPHWRIIRKLVKLTDYTVITPLYPLAPEFTWQDAFFVLQGLYMNILREYVGYPLTIIGDSAGGGMALAFSQILRDKNIQLPTSVVLLSPWLDVTMTNPMLIELQEKDKMLAIPALKWAGEQWAGKLDIYNPCISPIYGSLKDLPPIQVLSGTSDLTYADAFQLHQFAMEQKISLTFVEYKDLFHVWMAAPIPEANQALIQVADFIKLQNH